MVNDIAIAVMAIIAVLLILIPWMSIYDIHKSIDRVRDAINELTREVSKKK